MCINYHQQNLTTSLCYKCSYKIMTSSKFTHHSNSSQTPKLLMHIHTQNKISRALYIYIYTFQWQAAITKCPQKHEQNSPHHPQMAVYTRTHTNSALLIANTAMGSQSKRLNSAKVTGHLSLARAATNIIFIATIHVCCRNRSMLAVTNLLSGQNYVCHILSRQNLRHGKTTSILLSWQKTCFIATNTKVSLGQQKSKSCLSQQIFVVTNTQYFCHNKSLLWQATKDVFCCDKTFVMTKMRLVAAPTNDSHWATVINQNIVRMYEEKKTGPRGENSLSCHNYGKKLFCHNSIVVSFSSKSVRWCHHYVSCNILSSFLEAIALKSSLCIM